MACNAITLNGVFLDCGNVGGLQKIYISPIDAVSGITEGTGGTVTIAMNDTKKFKEFSFRKGNANFTSEGSQDDTAGTYFVTSTVTAQFNKMETAKRTEMVALTKAQCYVIALDQNGLFWLIGKGSYATSNVSAASGAQRADSNNYTLVITSETNELPNEVPVTTGLF